MKPYIKNRLWIISVLIILIFVYKTDFSTQLHKLYTVLSPVIISLLISWSVLPVKHKLENLLKLNFKGFIKTNAHLISAFTVYLMFIALILLFVICFIPVIKTGVSNIGNQLTNYRHIFEKYISQDTINTLLEKINPQVYIKGAKSTISVVFNIGMSFIVLIYILLEHKQLKKGVVEFVSFFTGDENAEKLLYYLSSTNCIFIRYFYSKFISSLILGLLVTIGFFITGISHPIFFGALVAIFNMLPIFGAFLSTLPIALLTFAEYGIIRALISVIIIIVGQQIENNILTPKIVGDTIGLSGFWIIFTIIVGGGLFGFWGLLICVPVAATIKMISVEIKERRRF